MKKFATPEIISIIAIIIFLVFALKISQPSTVLQGGDIQNAIDTKQYK